MKYAVIDKKRSTVIGGGKNLTELALCLHNLYCWNWEPEDFTVMESGE